LWRVFQNEVDDVREKNGEEPKIVEMYHGTSTTDPKLIYMSEEGFDMRFGKRGMWGLANYFAKNASYSDKYAHELPDGTKQMFVANVVIGISGVLLPDKTLKVPPVNPATQLPFDSI